MKIQKSKLLDALKALRPALSNKGVVEEMDAYIFTEKMVFTYNDRICIGCPVDTGLSCTVPADEFYNIVQQFTTDIIRLRMDEDANILEVEGGNIKAAIQLFPASLITELPVDTGATYTPLPPDFKQGVSLCAFSAAQDASLFPFTHLCVQEQYIYSSDKFRLSRAMLSQKMKHSFLLPASSALELSKIDSLVEYAVTDAWLFFKSALGIVFCTRYSEASFPETSHLFAISGPVVQLPDGMQKAIDACKIFSKEEYFILDQKMKIKIADGVMQCKGQNQKGWVTYTTEADADTHEIIFEINPAFLEKILEHTTTIQIGDGQQRLLIESENFAHIVALARTKEDG